MDESVTILTTYGTITAYTFHKSVNVMLYPMLYHSFLQWGKCLFIYNKYCILRAIVAMADWEKHVLEIWLIHWVKLKVILNKII